MILRPFVIIPWWTDPNRFLWLVGQEQITFFSALQVGLICLAVCLSGFVEATLCTTLLPGLCAPEVTWIKVTLVKVKTGSKKAGGLTMSSCFIDKTFLLGTIILILSGKISGLLKTRRPQKILRMASLSLCRT